MTEEWKVDPDDIGNVDEMSWRDLVFRFVSRQRRLAFFRKKRVPRVIIEAEENLVQKAYNQMREKCLKDKEYIAMWGDYDNGDED